MSEITFGVWEGKVYTRQDAPTPDNEHTLAVHTPPMEQITEYEPGNKILAVMGWDGFFVYDDRVDLIDMARAYMQVVQGESCGKCVPCREGTLRMLEILERITEGKGEMHDLDKLERLGKLIQKTSLCGLGQTAPNPVLSALENFREEFVTHIHDKQCPAHKCAQLIRYEINADKCTGCTLCARRCPVSCIAGSPRQPHLIDQSQCIKCGECFNVCKFDAVMRV